MRFFIRCLPALLAAGLSAACGGADAERPRLVVFAAASLRDVVGELGAELERREGARVVYNFAGSNTLAQQIRAAPRADVFLSADAGWVDVLERAGRTVAGSSRDVLANRLVLIVHRDSRLEIDEPRDLATAEYRFLALADPAAVPAGRYARAHLEAESLWQAVEARVAPALDVRAALALVESDPEIVGIVYKTDARTSDRVRVACELTPRDDAPITYRATLIAGGASPELGRRFLDLLASPVGREIAERHGFEVPSP